LNSLTKAKKKSERDNSMRAYATIRFVECPDKGDLAQDGRGRAMSLHYPDRPVFRNPKAKAAVRRTLRRRDAE
jgi:hypothetical protein